MLLYGGIGLLLGGAIIYFFGDKIQSDAAKAAKLRKQAPIVMLVGAAFLGLRLLIG